jgi:hypothetical protein
VIIPLNSNADPGDLFEVTVYSNVCDKFKPQIPTACKFITFNDNFTNKKNIT